MTDAALVDAAARAEALDPERSFIVQAPAGSGKTGLLIQRYLALLARVEQPEEIVAITFTRKAAAEMRTRIMAALRQSGDAPDEAYLRTTWELAQAVRRRDEEAGWGLAFYPSRLRIMTIDALCAALVAQMPVLARFGAAPAIAERPHALYRRAARRVLAALESDAADDLQTVLRHLDNDHRRVEALLIEMLARRDRWLPVVAGRQVPHLEREALENALTDCVESAYAEFAESLPDALVDELIEVVTYAAVRCPADAPLRACAALDAVPSATVEHRDKWDALAWLLTKKDGTLRKSVTQAQGFPAPSGAKDAQEEAERKDYKARFAALSESLEAVPGLASSLARFASLPPTRYRPEDWRMLQALRGLLPLAAAQLKVVFQERGEVDFTENTHRALAALGGDEAPTDLALSLDYRIAHLLVDEFQDTSRSQYELIERLTAGWMPGDGRTLFLVGDPMQSIYRFRDADVGLFLHARAHPIGQIALTPLQLQANFRTRPALVERNNAVFAAIFPERESPQDSAVAFAPAVAQREAADDAGLFLHATTDETGYAEAEAVVQCVRAAQAAAAQGTVAVLVRNRSHLARILPALARHGLRFGAIDIKPLHATGVVSDLWALTRALLHLADRTAWLALLRAPWCGLTLADLHALAGAQPKRTIWETIIHEGRRGALSDDGKLRLARIKRVLADALARKGRRDLRRWVEGTWTAIGGPACVATPDDLEDAKTYFDLLEAFEESGGIDDLDELASAVQGLYANHAHDRDERLQIMTLHKAKGLEFDTVIVPGLHRESPSDRRQLLNYLERTDAHGRAQLLIAPLHATGADDAIGRYLRQVDARRDTNEARRLLYVAATRAKESLHLFTRITLDDEGRPRPPPRRSLAALLWPALGEGFADALETTAAPTPAPPAPDDAERFALRRVPSAWMLPQAPQPKPWRGADITVTEDARREAEWAGDTARHVGTTVHRVLQQVATEGVDAWIGRWSDGLDHYLARMLANLGVVPGELDTAVVRAQNAVRNSLTDERGRWVLGRHASARNELALSGWLEGRLHNVVLDRTFVDDNGVRWIIDYKTGTHEGGTVDAFIDNQQERHRPQLELYARIMQRYDPTPIHLGLYFPLVQGWREWAFR